MTTHATVRTGRLPVGQLSLFECDEDQAAAIWPSQIGSRRMLDGPDRSPAGALARPTLTLQSPHARIAERKADRGGAPALTPRLIEIIAAMVDAVLDGDASDWNASGGNVMAPRSRQRDPEAVTGPLGGRR